jgi:hypothetical protein
MNSKLGLKDNNSSLAETKMIPMKASLFGARHRGKIRSTKLTMYSSVGVQQFSVLPHCDFVELSLFL